MFKKMDKVVIDVFKDWSIRLANHTQRPDVREKMHLSYRQHWRHQQRSVSLTTENQVSRLLLSETRWLWHRQGTSGCIKHRNSINIGERSIVMTVSVCVCLSASISLEMHVRSLPNFCACLLWPWLGPSLAASPYVMYFRFCGWRHTCAQTKAAQRGRPADGSTAHMQPLTWL